MATCARIRSVPFAGVCRDAAVAVLFDGAERIVLVFATAFGAGLCLCALNVQ